MTMDQSMRESYRARARRFKVTGPRRPGLSNTTVENFTTRDARDSAWRGLRAGNRKGVFRFTTQKDGQMVWCVAYPRSGTGREG